MRIELTINGDLVEGELFDHPVAREFAEMLPLTLAFNDFNHVEKVARMPRTLTLRGVPDEDAPEPGEIGYHAPSQGIVLYYDRPGKWPGLVRMGRFAYELNELRELPDGSRVQIALAANRGS